MTTRAQIGIVGAALACFAASFAAVFAWPFGSSRPACDDAEATAIVKKLALDRIAFAQDYVSGSRLLGIEGDDYLSLFKLALDQESGNRSGIDFALSAYRDRGSLGNGGRTCAAFIKVTSPLSLRRGAPEFSTEYSVEKASDGKLVVSARFFPNH